MIFRKKKVVQTDIERFRIAFLQHTAMTDKTYAAIVQPAEELIEALGLEKRLADAVDRICRNEHMNNLGKKQAAVLLVFLSVAEMAVKQKVAGFMLGEQTHYELNRVSVFLQFLNKSPVGCNWLLQNLLIEDAWRYLRGNSSSFTPFMVNTPVQAVVSETPSVAEQPAEEFVHVQISADDEEEEPISQTEISGIEGLLSADDDIEDPVSLLASAQSENETEPAINADEAEVIAEEEESESEDDSEDNGLSSIQALLNR